MRERLTGSIPDFPTTAGSGVYAAGVDLVDIDRLRLALARCGTPLLDRLFDADERAACADGTDTAVAAGLFGIKESIVKAVGGLPPGASYRDVHVGGAFAPGLIRLDGELARWADTRGVAMAAGGDPLTPGLALSWALATCDGEVPGVGGAVRGDEVARDALAVRDGGAVRDGLARRDGVVPHDGGAVGDGLAGRDGVVPVSREEER